MKYDVIIFLDEAPPTREQVQRAIDRKLWRQIKSCYEYHCIVAEELAEEEWANWGLWDGQKVHIAIRRGKKDDWRLYQVGLTGNCLAKTNEVFVWD